MWHPTPEGTQRYQAWRSRIPFTDGEVAGVLEVAAAAESRWPKRGELQELARRCRRGYVGKVAVAAAARYLVTTCGVCGGKALYHIGTEGRCSEHRRVLPTWAWQPADDRGVEAEVERD